VTVVELELRSPMSGRAAMGDADGQVRKGRAHVATGGEPAWEGVGQRLMARRGLGGGDLRSSATSGELPAGAFVLVILS
jgi:hypothetical protein